MASRRLARPATLLTALMTLIGSAAYAEPPVPKTAIPEIRDEEKEEGIKPLPPVAIPDDPPPHEGAMFDLPLVVDAPDLILIEVLTAMPGRPISGERLVRPDGMVTLGFYGNVYVRGLSPEQIKVKVVQHLRKSLPDDLLGLNTFNPGTEKIEKVSPSETNSVFVDIAAYNSRFYYLEGDLAYPGKLPLTGNETVLDALHYAGGLIPAADPDNIKLVRPARGDRPSKTYPIDLKAITEGDSLHNYQVFPGDRIIAGRRPVVQATVAIDQLDSVGRQVAQSLRQKTAMVRDFIQATPFLDFKGRKALFEDLVGQTLRATREQGDAWPDEKKYREGLLRLFDAANPPSAP